MRLVGLRFTKIYEAGFYAMLPLEQSDTRSRRQLMKCISICDRTGIVECEIFAAAYRTYGLNTVRYPVVQVTREVKSFENGQGFTLDVQRVVKALLS
ncbi:hypothetical protein [Prosthecobacter sp.]|uniref:hypothetical protein n=1 Tax=Prosthecobacter sp. TaxID=1965333 RepID=UPI002488DDB2|nr:hypothetical protein [Prosthecobacter sp.]MDI1313823.1 hypothetical protein [Prosthecobacter sp.]